MSENRLATNVFHLVGVDCSQDSTTVESVQYITGVCANFSDSLTNSIALTNKTAAQSSNLGTLWTLRGATFVLEYKREIFTGPKNDSTLK